MKRAVLHMRVSTVDQHPETQLHDLRSMARQRGYEIVREYTDRISGAKQKRPGLDELHDAPQAPLRCRAGRSLRSHRTLYPALP
jgi:DNA invertase Pin-like site-specific DNA recombinase